MRFLSMNYVSDKLLQNIEGFAHFDKGLDTAVELLGGVGCGELDADSRLALWHYWVVEACHINTLLLQCSCKLLAESCIVQHYRADS